MTNQVFSEAEEKQPLSPAYSGRDRNSVVDAPESGISDKSRWHFSSEDDEREIALEVPEEQSEVSEPDEPEVPSSKGLRWPLLLAGAGIGVWFEGVGAAPGAVIGGVVGAVGGGVGGFWAGHKVVTTVWDWIFTPLEKEEYVVVPCPQ